MKWNKGSDNLMTLTSAAFVLAFSILCLLLFRGPVSITSAFAIPAVIVIFSKGHGTRYLLYVSMGLIAVVMAFFQTQTIFILGYLLLSLALKFLLLDPDMNVKIRFLPSLGYILSVMLILYGCIRLTEAVFMIPLHTMMRSLSGNRPLLYAGILLIESLFVFFFNTIILRLYFTRLKKIS